MAKKPAKELVQFAAPQCLELVGKKRRIPQISAQLNEVGFFMPRKLVSQILFLDDNLSNAPDFDFTASSLIGSRIAAGRIASFDSKVI